ncbi:LOW QUALITY PROTEIN: T-complex protein 11-like protein 1 [Spinachia spinachia]
MPNQRDEDADESPADLPCLEKLDSPAGSPPTASSSRQVDLENCLLNLNLAHEIMVNRDFCFTPRSPATDSLQGRVTEVVHRAFWDRLREQLSSDPPDYSHAVTLLREVKTTLESLLLPGHVRLRAQLHQVLDMELIQQEVDHGALDLLRLAEYIINTMASLCAPVRDQAVRALRDLRDPVELLREIFGVLGLMKTDMVSFTIQSLRPHLLQQAVQYERAKFQQILDQQPASLDDPTAWLQAAAVAARSEAADVCDRAYERLLRWDPRDLKYPETLLMDRARLVALGQRLHLLELEASVLLLTNARCGDAVFSLPGLVGRRRALLEGSHTREADLKGALPGLGQTVLQLVTEAASSRGGGAALAEGSRDLLKGQISELWRHNHPVRTLVGERVQGFLRAALHSGRAEPGPQLPAALGPVSGELGELGAAFVRIVHFDRSVFAPFYAPVLGKLLSPAGQAEGGDPDDLR